MDGARLEEREHTTPSLTSMVYSHPALAIASALTLLGHVAIRPVDDLPWTVTLWVGLPMVCPSLSKPNTKQHVSYMNGASITPRTSISMQQEPLQWWWCFLGYMVCSSAHSSLSWPQTVTTTVTVVQIIKGATYVCETSLNL